MSRPIRIQYAGAVYHVMARGNERREIFRDDQDRQQFLKTVAEAVPQYGWRLYAYCLMPNHYHLVLSTPRGNLSRSMGWLQTTYTARFNARHRRRGHLFQGRFKAQLVEADEYARWLIEYVHLNPVRPRNRGQPVPVDRAGELRRYAWSSHLDYAGWRRPPSWLCMDWTRYWGNRRTQAVREYRKAIAHAFGRAASNPWGNLRGGLVLGGQEFYDLVRNRLRRNGGEAEAHWTAVEDAVEVRERVEQLLRLETDKRIRVWAAVRLGAERSVDVARANGYRDGSGVRQVIKRLERAAEFDRLLRQKLQNLSHLSTAKR